MVRPQSRRRPRRAPAGRGPKVRLCLEYLEDRTLPSSGEWLAVFSGISPADNLADQAQAGQNLLVSSGVSAQAVQVVSAFDLGGTFLLQTAATVDQPTLTAELQAVPGFVFAQDAQPDPIPPADPDATDQPVPCAPGDLPPQVDDPLVNNNNGSTGTSNFTQNTPSVLAFGNTVVTAFSDTGSAAGGANHFTGYAYSTDGGNTFTDGGALPNSSNGDGGDPVLAMRNGGRIFLATTQASGSGIDVFHSDNNGVSWSAPVQGAPLKSGPQAQPWITVDNFSGGPSGVVYLVERDNSTTGNGLYLFRSTDGGNTFNSLSGTSGGTLIASGSSDQGAYVTVGPDHSLYAFYYAGSSLMMRRAPYSGTGQGMLPFGQAITVATFASAGGANGDLGLTGKPNGETTASSFSTNKFPQAAINPVSGNIYVVYDDAGAAGDKADIKFTTSTNSGITWSTPARVNDDTTHTDQWSPSIAVSSDGAKLGIFYYSRQNDPTNDNLFQEYGRIGTISGSTVTFTPSFAVGATPSLPEFGRDSADSSSTDMGVYNQVVFNNNGFDVVWSDNSTALPGGGLRMDPNVYFATTNPILAVTGTTPAAGSTVSAPLTSFTVTTSAPINPSSIQPSLFKVNGVGATSDTYTAGSTSITFNFPTTPMPTQGLQTISVAAGAFSRASDGLPVIAFSDTFHYDAVLLAVTSTNPPFPNGVFNLPGPFTYDVNFNEAVNPATVKASDLTLSGIQGATVTGVTVLPGNTTAQFTLGGITTQGALTASIPSGAITDAFNNPGSTAFSATYQVDDGGPIPFPTPLSAVQPLGSLVYDPIATGIINFAGDTDSFTLAIDPGQTVTVLVTPSASLRPTVTLDDPNQTPLGAATATSAGRTAPLQTIPTTTGGTYTIVVGGAGNTTGTYTVQVILNAAAEASTYGGPSNNTRATAQDLSPSFITLQTPQASASRAAVAGQFQGNDNFYSFNLAAGQTITAGMKAFNTGTLYSGSTTYPGTLAQDVVYGDFSGNGLLDMAVLNTVSNPPGVNLGPPGYITVFMNLGGGVFGPGTNYPVGHNAFAIATGDIAGDGKLDLVVSNDRDGTVSVLLGNGDGTFQPAVTYSMSQIGEGSDGLVVGDFNHDGRADVAVVNPDELRLYVRLGQANGTLGPALTETLPNRDFRLASGDLNGDGNLDLVAVDNFGDIDVLLGKGDGTFANAVTYTSFAHTSDVALGDFNGDGKLDIAVLDGFQNFGILLGNGDGTFQPMVATSSGIDLATRFAVADLNGDGRSDVVVVNNTSGGTTPPAQISVLFSTGGTSFSSPHITTVSAGLDQEEVTLADINGDGILDVTTANGASNSVSVLPGLPPTVQLQLQDSNGNVLATGAATANPANLTAALNFTAPAAGAYYLRVTGSGSANYNLVLTRDAAFDTGGNNTISTAQDVSGAEGVLGSVAAAPEWYSLNVASAGSAIRLETSTPAGGPGQFVNNLIPQIDLYDPSGMLVASGSLMADGRNQFIQYQPLVAGTYSVRVTANGGTSGEYFLSKNLSPAVTLSATSPINENDSTTLDGAISDDPQDSHTVDLGWGDGSPDTILNLAAGVSTFSTNHQYLDNLPGNAPYTISALVTDNHGASGSGSTSVVVNNVAPSNVVLTPSPAVINENDSTTVSGSFTDPGTLDTHTVDLNWDDGSSDTILSLAAGVLTFSASHQYLDNPAGQAHGGSFLIGAVVTDKDGDSGAGSTSVVVNNVAPSNVVLTPSPAVINENDTTTVSGSFTDPGTLDTHTVDLSWADGSSDTILDLAAGVLTFSASHQYLDNLPGNAPYTVSAVVTDKDGDSGSGTTSVIVNNVPPTVSAAANQSANEGVSSAFALGSFSDPGTLDAPWTVTVNWGDNSASTTFTTNTQGTLAQQAHTFAEEGTYTVTVGVTDKDGGMDAGSFTVNVADPAVAAVGVPVNALRGKPFNGAPVAVFADPGGPEAVGDYTDAINWGDNTTSTGAISPNGALFTVTGAHTYSASGTYTILTTINHEGVVTQVTTSATVKDNIGILILNPAGSGALTDTGNGSVTVTGPGGTIAVNSSSASAVTMTGNGTVSATDVDLSGGVRTTGHGQLLGTEFQQGPAADPLNLPLPPAPTTTFGAVNYSGSAPLTLSPGAYVGGIKITGQAAVTLLPGVYYLQGGGFSVTGQASVTGSGVLLVNAPATSSDSISFTGQGNINLTAPATLSGVYAPYQGIAIFQDPASSAPINLTGQPAVNVTGVIYAPRATLNLTGNGSLQVNSDAGHNLNAEVIVSNLNVAGNGGITVNLAAPAAAPTDPLLAALTALASDNGVDAFTTLMAQTLLTEAAAVRSGGSVTAAIDAYFTALGTPPGGGPASVATVLANPTLANEEWLLWFLAESLIQNGQGV